MAALLEYGALNGVIAPLRDIKISPLERGFLYGDGVYEVVPVYAGRPLALDAHLARLERSLAAIRLEPGLNDAGWRQLLDALIERNGGGDMAVYVQVSRAMEAGRDHRFPPANAATVFAMASELAPATEDGYSEGVAAVTVEDVRWPRCDIKSVSLLANVLARQEAAEAEAAEAIFLLDGVLTEAAASAVLIVERGAVVAPPLSPRLLPSVTRLIARRLAADCRIPWREEEIPEAQLRAAGEVLLLSSTREIAPVTRLDGEPVGEGRPGPVWRTLFRAFVAERTRERELAGERRAVR